MEENIIYNVSLEEAIKKIEIMSIDLKIKKIAIRENNRTLFLGTVEEYNWSSFLIYECNPLWNPKIKSARLINNILVLEVSEL